MHICAHMWLFSSWKWKEEHQSPESASEIQGQCDLVTLPNYLTHYNTARQAHLICLWLPSAPDTSSSSAQTANPAYFIGSA